MQRAILAVLSRILLIPHSVYEVRASREAEILVLRQQLLVLRRSSRKRLSLRSIDRLILVWLCRLFSSVSGGGHREAGGHAPVASKRFSRLLTLEVLARWRQA